MKRKILGATILSLIMGSAIAAPMSSKISLNGGNIAPAQELKIELGRLISNVQYTVTCDISDANNDKNPVTVHISGPYSPPAGAISLNGKLIGNASAQDKLPQVQNVLKMEGVYNFSGVSFLSIINTDQDDTIAVSNCSAIAS